MTLIANLIARLDLWVSRALDGMVIFLAGLLLLLLNYAVFARFVLNDSVSWGEELPAHILATLTFIGAAYLTRTNEHLGFDAVLRVLPTRLKAAVTIANLALMAGFGALLASYGGVVALSFWGRQLISLDLPMTLFRAAMPVGGALIAAIAVIRIGGILTGRVRPDDLLPETDA